MATSAAIIAPIIIYSYMTDGFARFLIVCSVSFISVLLSALYLGLTKNERNTILNKCKGILSKL